MKTDRYDIPQLLSEVRTIVMENANLNFDTDDVVAEMTERLTGLTKAYIKYRS